MTNLTTRIVGFSGGIDSQACALWVRHHFPDDEIILLNSNAGRNESPLTEQFISDYSGSVFPVVEANAIYADLWKTVGFPETKGYQSDDELTFLDLAKVKGRWPSRCAQFCTEILKLRPQKRWVDENIDSDYERYTGVRRDESFKRKNTQFREWDDYFDCYVNHPLADWTKTMCFDYVKSFGEEFNPLYKLGFSRVGCAPCINSGKDDISLWHSRSPEMIDKIRKYEEESGRTFFAPMVPGMYTNTIDDVLKWSNTSRGGRQQDFIKTITSRPACESKYGLCE